MQDKLLAFAVVLGALSASRTAAQLPVEDTIVYARCPRLTTAMEVAGEVTVNGVTRSVTRELFGLDTFDRLPDVTNFFGDFTAPCDLMLREPSGEERVLYDCTSTSTEAQACAALDPAVSFDGRTIAFAVFRGTLAHPSMPLNAIMLDPNADNEGLGGVDLPSWLLKSTESQLYLVDVASGEVTALPHEDGVFDSGPAFLPNGRLAFTSTRDGNRATLIWSVTHHKVATRIWSMDLDGGNVDLSSHHSLAMQQHPYVLRDGRVAYSSWQVAMGRPFRYSNGSVRGPDTTDNLFHLFTQSPDGAHNFALYGMHSGDHVTSSFGATHIASHFMTQTRDGRVWTGDYYRGNNSALGNVVGIMPEPEGQEGVNPFEAAGRGDWYVPRDAVNLASWSSSNDDAAKPLEMPAYMHPNYPSAPLPFAGKIGHPAALSSDGLMIAWGKGPCFRSEHSIVRIMSGPAGMPGCDIGLYRSPIPSVHPNDLTMIVDSAEWHEIMGRAVVPYDAVHGVAQPDVIARADLETSRWELETGTPFGLLGAASILDRETAPRDGIHFEGLHQFHQQGTDTIDYTDDELCGVRILGVMPNRGTLNEVYDEHRFNPAGERIGVLGEIAVRNRDANGEPVVNNTGVQDTSFLLRMPANVPYFMQSIDCDGRTLNTDQTWQHLRPGEMKTCGGCHVHSKEAATDFEDSFAALESYQVPTLGEGTVPLLAGENADGSVETRDVDGYGMFIDFEQDIMPIFQDRCVSCHGGMAPAGGLDLGQPGTADQAEYGGTTKSTWFCLVNDAFQECVLPDLRAPFMPGFSRPQLTRYVRAFNARGSLLYWKAAGERTDNRADTDFDFSSAEADVDVDFGPAHTTGMTDDELGLLSRWIDLGAAGGIPAHDTQRPTLHLSAMLSGDTVTELRVGATDLGDGVDPASLVVCVLAPDDTCADLSGDANRHGVVSIELASPLSDLSQEVLARVSDHAGNVTEVRRSVGWLLNSPPPPPPGGGPAGPVGGGDASSLVGGCGCRVASAPQANFPRLLVFGFVAFGLLRRRRR